MTGLTRQPPRFVPTLTEVVTPRDAPAAQPAVPERSVAQAAAMPGGAAATALPATVATVAATAQTAMTDWVDMAQHLQDRVLAQVQPQLQARLQAVVAEVVQVHTALLYQSLSDELLKTAVCTVEEVVAQELAALQAQR